MKCEELEVNMHFSYLVGSVMAHIVSNYFQIIEYKMCLKGYVHEESTSIFNIHLRMVETLILTDEEFAPLFEQYKPFLKQFLIKLKVELPIVLPLIANSPTNNRLGGKSLITSTAFACDDIWWGAIFWIWHQSNTLPNLVLRCESILYA